MSHRPAYLEDDPLGTGVPPPSNGQRSRPGATDRYPAEMLGDAWEGHRLPGQAPPPPAAAKSLPHPEFAKPVLASELKDDADGQAWLWHGFIGEKSITLFSALWKAGKTTLLANLIRNMATGEECCGREVTPANVLYISEESQSRWRKRRDKLGINDNVAFICRPFKGKPSMPQWLLWLEYIEECAIAHKANLVVLDTLSALWPVKNENDASEVQAALMPLWGIAKHAAVLPVHHLKKGDGQEATGSRGSGALTGFVDTIVELRRFEAGDAKSRKRVLTAFGRDDETPPETVIELSAGGLGYRAFGAKSDLRNEEIRSVLLGMLPRDRPGLTFEEISNAWPGDESPRRQDLMHALATGTELGDWTRDGSGRKNHPYMYVIPR